jgi:hypothetical protein
MPLLEVVWVISPRPRLATRPETTLRRRSHGSASCAARSGGQGWRAAPPAGGPRLARPRPGRNNETAGTKPFTARAAWR